MNAALIHMPYRITSDRHQKTELQPLLYVQGSREIQIIRGVQFFFKVYIFVVFPDCDRDRCNEEDLDEKTNDEKNRKERVGGQLEVDYRRYDNEDSEKNVKRCA